MKEKKKEREITFQLQCVTLKCANAKDFYYFAKNVLRFGAREKRQRERREKRETERRERERERELRNGRNKIGSFFSPSVF